MNGLMITGEIIIFLAGLTLFLLSLSLKTENFKSLIVYRFIPLVLGVGCWFVALVWFGVTIGVVIVQ